MLYNLNHTLEILLSEITKILSLADFPRYVCPVLLGFNILLSNYNEVNLSSDVKF